MFHKVLENRSCRANGLENRISFGVKGVIHIYGFCKVPDLQYETLAVGSAHPQFTFFVFVSVPSRFGKLTPFREVPKVKIFQNLSFSKSQDQSEKSKKNRKKTITTEKAFQCPLFFCKHFRLRSPHGFEISRFSSDTQKSLKLLGKVFWLIPQTPLNPNNLRK